MAKSDMFLRVESARAGRVSGESRDPGHTDEIDLESWSWGMSTPTGVGGASTGRTTIESLNVVKRADKASTALMSMLRTNDVVKKAVLSVRKASGGTPIDYFIVTIERGRVCGYRVDSGVSEEGAPVLFETVQFSFQAITVDYHAQTAKGLKAGGSSFSADLTPT